MTTLKVRTPTGWQEIALAGPPGPLETWIGADAPTPRGNYVTWIDTNEPEAVGAASGAAGGDFSGTYPNPTLVPGQFAAVRGWNLGVMGLSPVGGAYQALKGGAYQDANLDITGGPTNEVWEFQSVVVVSADQNTATDAVVRLRIHEVNTNTEVAVSYMGRVYDSTGGLRGQYSVMLVGLYTIPALAVRRFQVQGQAYAGTTCNLGSGGRLANILIGRCVTTLRKGTMSTPAGGLSDTP